MSMTGGVEGRVGGYCNSGEVGRRANWRSMVGEEGRAVSGTREILMGRGEEGRMVSEAEV